MFALSLSRACGFALIAFLGAGSAAAPVAPAAPVGPPPTALPPAVNQYREKVLESFLEQEEKRRLRGVKPPSPAKPPSLHTPAPPARPPLNVASAIARSSSIASLKPYTVPSKDHRVDVGELVIDYNNPDAPNPLKIGNDRVKLRTYNQQLVGPVIRAKAGDTIYLTVRNNLPPEPPPPGGVHITNGHHEWNTTNLHFHGLHVAPQGTPDAESDNVLLSIKPVGGFQKYAVHIPEDHVAGTFWYHAHRHGSTAAQVASGLCGALIIDRDDDKYNLDSVPEVAAAGQEIMVLQAVPYLIDPVTGLGVIERSPDGSGTNEDRMFGPENWYDLKHYVTVNGQRIPTIVMAPGEVRRLRLVAAGQRESVKLRIEKPAAPGELVDRMLLHEIAVDGLPTGGIRTLDELELFPGYRSDVLIQAPDDAAGTYYVIDGNASTDPGADGSPEPVNRIAQVRIVGAPVAMNLPPASALKAHRLPDLSEGDVSKERYAFYGIVRRPKPLPVGFFISRDNIPATGVPEGSEFDPGPEYVRTLTLGQTERWLVGARNTSPIAAIHPFHIHINPFLITQVLDAGGQDVTVSELGGPTWRDTLAMKQGYTYRFLTKYERYAGDFVSHCHVLDHEDNGMMERISIVDPKAPIARPANPGATYRAAPRVSTTIPAPAGKPSVLLFVKDSLCPHCREQIVEMAAKLPADRVDITVISASTVADLQAFPPSPFLFVADPEYRLFREFRVFDGVPKHGTIVRDRGGREVLRQVGDQPFMNVAAILGALREAGPRVVVAIRETDTPDDDYLTWAPTLSSVRVENGTPGGPDLNVVLTNDPAGAIPEGGDVAFAPASLPVGETATQPRLELTLKQDGTPVKFYVAGAKAGTLTPASLANKGRDAGIEVRENVAGGMLLGQASAMVRVRKRMDKISDLELNEFLKAMNDLHRVKNRFEWYVYLHRLATGHGVDEGDPDGSPEWPDQAHRGPAFIAWHRAFLLQFERELQQDFPWVALPYWVQGLPQTFFTPTKLGANVAGGSDAVNFDPASPIYGWSIDTLEHDPRFGATGIMGLLRRSAADHNVAAPFFQQWSPDLKADGAFKNTMPNYWALPLRNPNKYNVELNPHNNGHGWVGPADLWMQNCRESNADPVFWVFHCNHDQLWAHWQYEHHRFATDGKTPDHYWPNDAFTDPGAEVGVPLGHHLNDTMWPWDGTIGPVVPNQPNGNRPNVNGFGAFPASRAAGLWPPAPAAPKPAHVIDYLGVGAREDQLGFCYDEIPFGVSPTVPPPAVPPAPPAEDRFAAEVFLNNRIDPVTRKAAVAMLQKAPANIDARRLSQTIRDAGSASTLRADALQLLAQASAEEARAESVQLLNHAGTPAALSAAAIEQLGRSQHFAHGSHEEMRQAQEAVRAALASHPAGEVRARALHFLAPQGDPAAKTALLAALAEPARAPISTAEALALLRFFSDQKGAIRGFLASSNDDAVEAAIRSLHRDDASADTRRKLAADSARSVGVRRAAVQSLMHGDDARDVETLLSVFANLADDLSLRAEAIAAARVFLQRRLAGLTPGQKAAWTEKIRAVSAETSGAASLGELQAQALGVLTAR
ncbi:MAG TPA: tyrosinase family protein [Chthoniobacteraceae bacterium]|jgi:FtsP/CotA-like multicopper oxidase with cupredoxin domain|nr:tyrosinase family protein [Chthoniobacteraceae bacterium]